MSKSPYIPPEVKAYMEQHKLEEVIKDSVNQILQNRPTDPFTSFSEFYGKLSTPAVTLEAIDGFEILNSEMKATIHLKFQVLFKNQSLVFNSPLYFSQATVEQEVFYDDESKSMRNAIQQIKKLSTSLQSKNVKEQKSIDDALIKYLTENRTHVNVTQQISFSMLLIQANFLNQSFPSLLCAALNKPSLTAPKIFVNIFQGSKIVASKCKVYKFYLINHDEGGFGKLQAVAQNVRKSIVSGKKGEAGLQFYVDGTFICPADTVIDNIKMIEQAIDAAQAKDIITIGLSWLAELFYEQAEKKYDLDNPKKLLDADQMIDYYFKLCTDKSVITYLEDPLHFADYAGWQKLVAKFKDTKVKIGTRRLYQTLEKAKKHCEPTTAQTNPELTEQQLIQLNNEKINVDYVMKPLFEFPTFTEAQTYTTYLTQKKPQLQMIWSDALFDSEDSYLVDFAFATPNGCLNLGPPIKYEKLIKYNKFTKLCHEIRK